MTTVSPPSAPPREGQWAIVARMFRRNRPAVWAFRVTVVLVLLAIYAPLIACGVPLLRSVPAGGFESPWLARLFDVIIWEHGVDRFFNSLLVSLTLGGVAAGVVALVTRPGHRRWRWVRWYAGAAMLVALVQASGFALVSSRPYEDFSQDPERLEFLAEHGARWAEGALRTKDSTAALLPSDGVPRDPAALRGLADAVTAWIQDKPEREATDARHAAAALRRAADGLERSAKARADGGSWVLRAPIPYGHRDQRGGREEQFVRFGERADHLLGTDIQGRDIFARILYGTRISLTIGIVAVSIYVLIGTVLGALAGYFGRKVDMLIMRLVEVVICVPSLFLIMMIVALTENRSIFLIMVAIGLVGWTSITRLVRGQFLRERALDYVTAARALGLPTRRVIFRHVLPNAFAPVLVAATFGVAAAILTENTLSFIGLGDPTVPSWGRVLNDGRDSGYWHLILPPTLAIFITVTALNLVGDGIRDALDPKLRN